MDRTDNPPPPPPEENPPDPIVAFGTAELSSALSLTSQTLSPDARTLSMILAGLSVQVQGSGPRGGTAAGSLTVPLTGVASPTFVKMILRGEAAIAGSSANGRVTVEINGLGMASGFSEPGATIQQEFSLQISPVAPVIVLNFLVSCQAFGADANASALMSLDSLDLALE